MSFYVLVRHVHKARSFPIGFRGCNNACAIMHGTCLEKLKGLYPI